MIVKVHHINYFKRAGTDTILNSMVVICYSIFSMINGVSREFSRDIIFSFLFCSKKKEDVYFPSSLRTMIWWMSLSKRR